MAQAQRQKAQAPANMPAAQKPVEQQLGALTKTAQIVDLAQRHVEDYLQKGSLVLPSDYSVGNAMHMAQLTLLNTKDKNGTPALQTCTRNSIFQALLDMAFQGLNPAKKQCWFIAYGDQLTMQRSYFGDIRLAKLVDPDIEDVVAAVIYKGDKVTTRLERGQRVVVEHEQDWMNSSSGNIVGAYANIIYRDGHWTSTIMTMDQIRACWRVGKAQMNSPAHKETPDQMVMRTAIRRACKPIINSASDATLLGQSIRHGQMENAHFQMEQTVANRTNVVNLDLPEAAGQTAPSVELTASAPVQPIRSAAPGAPVEEPEVLEACSVPTMEPDAVTSPTGRTLVSNEPDLTETPDGSELDPALENMEVPF